MRVISFGNGGFGNNNAGMGSQGGLVVGGRAGGCCGIAVVSLIGAVFLLFGIFSLPAYEQFSAAKACGAPGSVASNCLSTLQATVASANQSTSFNHNTNGGTTTTTTTVVDFSTTTGAAIPPATFGQAIGVATGEQVTVSLWTAKNEVVSMTAAGSSYATSVAPGLFPIILGFGVAGFTFLLDLLILFTSVLGRGVPAMALSPAAPMGFGPGMGQGMGGPMGPQPFAPPGTPLSGGGGFGTTDPNAPYGDTSSQQWSPGGDQGFTPPPPPSGQSPF